MKTAISFSLLVLVSLSVKAESPKPANDVFKNWDEDRVYFTVPEKLKGIGPTPVADTMLVDQGSSITKVTLNHVPEKMKKPGLDLTSTDVYIRNSDGAIIAYENSKGLNKHTENGWTLDGERKSVALFDQEIKWRKTKGVKQRPARWYLDATTKNKTNVNKFNKQALADLGIHFRRPQDAVVEFLETKLAELHNKEKESASQDLAQARCTPEIVAPRSKAPITHGSQSPLAPPAASELSRR